MIDMRGKLTEEIEEKAVAFLGRKISQKELRLYPYIDFCLKNCGAWDYGKMNEDEFKILNKLYAEKHIIYSPEKIVITRKFYNYMQDVLAISYVWEFL